MPFFKTEHVRSRRPRNQSISAPLPKPTTQSLSPKSLSQFHFPPSNNNNGSKETKNLLPKKPKQKKIFTSLTLGSLGCGPSSSPVDWEAEKVRTEKKRRRRRMKKQRETTSSAPNTPVVDVCCAPGVGLASDVIPRSTVGGERTIHRVRACSARRTANNERVSASELPSAFCTNPVRSNVSTDRESHRLRRHSPIVMFQHDLLTGGRSDAHDQYGDWRLDVDSMSYEELLDLSDRIGYVRTGLREDEIFQCLRRIKHSKMESLPLLMTTERDWKCSICQEGWKEDDKMGRLDCGHYHHLHCIKQWLLQKNACPVCKTAAVAADK